jgi:non-heme chloroperoxidase
MSEIHSPTTSRRNLLMGPAAFGIGALSQTTLAARTVHAADRINSGGSQMSIIKTKDGTEIFYKDWGIGQPIVFSHGAALSR